MITLKAKRIVFGFAVTCFPLLSHAEPPPEGSPDWILTHNDAKQIESAISVNHQHCCSTSDGRPLNDYGIRFNVEKHHYEIRFNLKRWTEGTVSTTPSNAEEGDIWIEAYPGMITFDYQPEAFTMAWVGSWQSWDGTKATTGATLYCVTVKGGV